MEDIRCTKCNKVLAKKAEVRYVEIKCPRCRAYNIIDRDLTKKNKQYTMNNGVMI